MFAAPTTKWRPAPFRAERIAGAAAARRSARQERDDLLHEAPHPLVEIRALMAEVDHEAVAAGVEVLDEPGPPLLAGAVGWLRGRVLAEHPAGTHTFFVGEIDSADPGPSDRPLAYFGHAYHGL